MNDSAAVRALDWFESPVGPLIGAATDEAVCQLQFSDRETLEPRLAMLRKRYAGSLGAGPGPLLGDLRRQLDEYFRNARRDFDLPLVYPGSPFQEKVWSALRRIPYGRTWSYLDLALHIGDASATRAVGGANGMNPICIVIPCHRVINANGDLGGFGGGLARKRILLDLESGQQRLAFD
jgi:AraC family transcriptional regulator of adaptative response/methylated-DNA-[protein]-cysteine methyltransferase